MDVILRMCVVVTMVTKSVLMETPVYVVSINSMHLFYIILFDYFLLINVGRFLLQKNQQQKHTHKTNLQSQK